MSNNEGIGITIHGQRPASHDRREAESPLRALIQTHHPPGPVRSLYLHVPFCSHKCHYCDFYSFVDRADRQADFTDALILELTAMSPLMSGGLDTLFVGGGTPSLLAPRLWERLLHAIAALVPGFPSSTLEFTVECNPESVTPELARVLASGGVNRVSMGAQSFNTTHLRTLERRHDPENVARALAIVRDAGVPRRNIDLIYAIPSQTLDDWSGDVSIAAAFAARGLVDHVSAYALTYEPNTPMTVRMRRGEFAPADDEIESAMYEHAVDAFRHAGMGRYEVSNFARPGSECRHNLAYWRGDQWLAAGPSASAHIAGHRWKNIPKLSEWMEGVARTRGYPPVTDHEPPDPARELRERIMMGLRTREGLPLAQLLADARALGREKHLRAAIQSAAARHQVEQVDDAIRLRGNAYLWADGIAARLMDAISDD